MTRNRPRLALLAAWPVVGVCLALGGGSSGAVRPSPAGEPDAVARDPIAHPFPPPP